MRRLGRFSISRDAIDKRPDTVRLVMASVIAARAELMWQSGAVEYVALSPCFDEIHDHECAPEYLPTLHEEGPIRQIRLEWKRVL